MSFESFFQPTATPEPAKQSVGRVDAALNSSLHWDGPKPSWWESYAQKSMNHEYLSSTPELLDVIDSPVGKLAVVWQEQSQSDGDAGVVIGSGMGLHLCKFKSFDTGEDIAYLKLAYMDDETVERTFGDDEFTPYRWQDRWGGMGYPFDGGYDEPYGNRDLAGDELSTFRKKVWLAAQKDVGNGITTSEGKYIPTFSLDVSHTPQDDKAVVKDLRTLAKDVNKDIKAKKKYFGTPYVDYSRVDERLKGKGFGTALYVYAARHLGNDGKVLRGSMIQSDEAEALWSRFKQKFPQNVSSIKLNYRQKGTAPTLDFRRK